MIAPKEKLEKAFLMGRSAQGVRNGSQQGKGLCFQSCDTEASCPLPLTQTSHSFHLSGRSFLEDPVV